MPLLLVALGGALGSVLRYLAQASIYAWFPNPFPLGTLAVNLVGSLLIGFLGAAFEAFPSHAFAIPLRHLLLVGVLGGFTTFSSFSLENLNLLRAGEWRMALLYMGASNVLGLLLALAGFQAGRLLLRAG
jgi:CrcB protein